MNMTFGVLSTFLLVGCGGATVGGFCTSQLGNDGKAPTLKLEAHITDDLSGCYEERPGLDNLQNWTLTDGKGKKHSISTVSATTLHYDCSAYSNVEVTLAEDSLPDGEYELTHSVDGDELTHEFSVKNGDLSGGRVSRDTKMPSPCD